MILEKAFWEIIFGSEDVLHVYSFLKTYSLIVANMKDYVTLHVDYDDADFRYNYRDVMIAPFKQDLYNQYFSLQDDGKSDQIDALQNKIKFWFNIVDDTGVQYFMIFIIMIIKMIDWISLFAAQRYFLRLEK